MANTTSKCITKDFQVDSTEGRIYVRQWMSAHLASNIPLILLHDSLGSVALWREFPANLASHLSRTVIAYDRPGFGQSDAQHELPGLNFIEQSPQIFSQIKNQLGIGRYILLGHSVGGAMAINIAARDADCIGVITLAAQAFIDSITIAGIRNARELFKSPQQFDRLKKYHGDKAEWVLKAWTEVWLSPTFSKWSLDNCIDKLTCPVLAIHGDKDEYGTQAFPEYITHRAGGYSEMLLIKDCGHMPHQEQPEVVIEAVNLFINSQI